MQTFRVTCVHIQNVQFLQIIQFSVDSIIKRRQQHEEFGVVIQELKLYHDRFQDVSGAVWTPDGVAGKRIWEGTETISELTDTEQQVRIVSTSLYICGASWISWKFWVLVQKFLAEHSLNWDFSLWNSEQTSIFQVRKSLKFEVSGMHYHYCWMLWVLSTDCSGQLYLFSCEKWKNQT